MQNTNSTKIISLQFLHLLLSLSLYQIFDKILRELNYLKWFASIHELRTSPNIACWPGGRLTRQLQASSISTSGWPPIPAARCPPSTASSRQPTRSTFPTGSWLPSVGSLGGHSVNMDKEGKTNVAITLFFLVCMSCLASLKQYFVHMFYTTVINLI